MAITSTGSTLNGLNNGLGNSLYGAGSPYKWDNSVLPVVGAPSAKVTNMTGSQLAFDVINQQYYISLAQNGSTWIKLGSVS